jgi:hypothetical protein
MRLSGLRLFPFVLRIASVHVTDELIRVRKKREFSPLLHIGLLTQNHETNENTVECQLSLAMGKLSKNPRRQSGLHRPNDNFQLEEEPMSKSILSQAREVDPKMGKNGCRLGELLDLEVIVGLMKIRRRGFLERLPMARDNILHRMG